MEFGKVPPEELDTINFSLPAEPAFNKAVLKGTPVAQPKIYIGCAKWGRKEWVGKIYPPKTKEKDFLSEYVHHYNSIELNATHYKIYDAAFIKNWRDKAGNKDFLFCPKLVKDITHANTLAGKEKLTAAFLDGIFAFGRHLGPIFIQVSESFSPARRQELYSYLEILPADLQFFVEVRHPDFFSDKKIEQEFFSTLRNLHVGAIITDTAGRRDCAHMHLPIPKAFIRYVGNSMHATDDTRIDAWVKRIQYWLDKGLKELYFFMHMHNETTSPDLTIKLVDKLNEVCGLNIVKPVFIEQQKSLFG